MQLKKIRTGVVYATHRSGESSRDNGSPIVVLDTTTWEQNYGHSATTYRPLPSATPGKGATWSRAAYGLPMVTIDTRDDLDADTLAGLLAVAKIASDHLAAHTGGAFTADLPDVGGRTVRFGIVVPREVQAEWGDYVAARKARRDERDAARERDEARKRARVTAASDARARIAAVLPDDAVVASAVSKYGEDTPPTLSWTALADLLDRYADARP